MPAGVNRVISIYTSQGLRRSLLQSFGQRPSSKLNITSHEVSGSNIRPGSEARDFDTRRVVPDLSDLTIRSRIRIQVVS